MTSGAGRAVFALSSGGRRFGVEAPMRLTSWWSQIAPHLPGVSPDVPLDERGNSAVDLVVPETVGHGDVRRLLNAGLHRLHLEYGTLCVQACALRRPGDGGSVLLLGGHGAGKTLVATALALGGWEVLAGDVSLLDVAASGSGSVRGGTVAFLARRAPIRRWFPEIDVGGVETDKVDLRDRFVHGTAADPARLLAVMSVDVDGDPQANSGVAGLLDRHTASTLWLRSSGHLLDRVMEDDHVVLRDVEDAAAIRHRLTLIRSLAAAVPVHTVWGAPRSIAARIEELTTTGQQAW